MEIITVLVRTLFFYFFVIIMFRIMVKREVGQLGIIDLIVSILIAELMAISIENTEDSIWMTISPILLLTFLEVGLAFVAIKSRAFRNFLSGKPANIITHGKLRYSEMVKQRYCLDDLMLHLRQQGIKSIEDVEYALLENNGKLSVFKYNLFKLESSYPMPIIVDGKVQPAILKNIKKSSVWLDDSLIVKI